MLLSGFGVTGYRSLSGHFNFVGPLSRLNVIAGPNNSGKSNIVRYLTNHHNSVVKLQKSGKEFPDFAAEDIPRSSPDQKFMHFFCVPGTQDNALRMASDADNFNLFEKMFNKMIRANNAYTVRKCFWIPVSKNPTATDINVDRKFAEYIVGQKILARNEWVSLIRSMEPSGGGKSPVEDVVLACNLLINCNRQLPDIEFVKTNRDISKAGESALDHTGSGIINLLVEHKDPDYLELEKQEKYKAIEIFLKNILRVNNLQIRIPHSRNKIEIDIDGKVLPITSLGTGIHQALIFAIMGTVLEDFVICIEEPETNLHPVLQRELITYLLDNTSNQYILTTHSAHFLDIPGATVFNCFLENGYTNIDVIESDQEKYEACRRLGYKPSDLLQTNCVLWVEGPSDRVYINAWIKGQYPNLREGLHYSIMFYGGRLLKHVSANETDVSNFVSLRRLNRGVAVIMDSDKTSRDKDINDTKKRVVEEIENKSGFVWVTEGREIENYISVPNMEAALKSVDKTFLKLSSVNKFHKRYVYLRESNQKVESVDKVKLAQKIVDDDMETDVLNLRQMVTELCQFILSYN